MSTIPDNPFDASKPETYPATPSTADQRGQHAAGNAAFAATKNDVVALEQTTIDAGDGLTGGGALGDGTGSVALAADYQGSGGNLGVATQLARSDHRHANTDGTGDGFMAAADKVKLDSLDATSINAHIADVVSNPHAVGHDQTGPVANQHVDHSTITVTGGEGLTGGGDLTASRVLDASWGGSGGDFGSAVTIARSDHLHSQYLTAVEQDTAPALGGDLQTKGYYVDLTRADDSAHGAIGPLASGSGSAFVYWDGTGAYEPTDGGLVVNPGRVTLYGSTTTVETLKHSEPGGRQVYVDQSGDLYGVDPPDPGWTANDTDVGVYDIGGGTGTGIWTEVTGLNVLTAADLEINDRLDISVSLYVTEDGGRSGFVNIGFTVDATPPTEIGGTAPVSPGYAGFINVAFSTSVTQAYPAGTSIRIWAQSDAGGGPQYDPNLDGSIQPHELFVSVPGAGGGGVGSGIAKGTPFVQGQMLQVQSTANDGVAQTVAFSDKRMAVGQPDGSLANAPLTYDYDNLARLGDSNSFQSDQLFDAQVVLTAADVRVGHLEANASSVALFGSSDGSTPDRDLLFAADEMTAVTGQFFNVSSGELQEGGKRALTVAGGLTMEGAGGIGATALLLGADGTGYTGAAPNPSGGNWRYANTALTINAPPTEVGSVNIEVAAGTTVNLAGSGYTEVGSQPGGAANLVLALGRIGGAQTATWLPSA